MATNYGTVMINLKIIVLGMSIALIFFVTFQFASSEGTSNMSGVNKDHFSPFYKVRKVLLAFRILLGFPLRPTNNAYNEFEFKPFLEYARLVLVLCISLVSFGYMSYLTMKDLDIWNPFEAMLLKSKLVGISEMDHVVVLVLPVLNIFLTIAYFLSFKTVLIGLNKTSGLLTKINEETYDTKLGMKLSYEVPYWRFFFAFGIYAFAIGMYTSCWYDVLLSKASTKLEKIIFCCVAVLNGSTCIYPFMSMSADFLVFHLVDETSAAFDKFRLRIKYTNKFHGETRRKMVSGPACEDKNHISLVPR